MELIFLDTEATGVDLTKDRLCQVSFKTSSGMRTEYFKPPVAMTVKSMSITHITDKMLVDKPAFESSQMKKDLQVLLMDGVLVAHNAKFDIAMLALEGVEVKRYICTLRMARYLDTKGAIPEYNLQFLRYYLGLEVEGNPHDAEGDVNVLCAVFDRQLSKMMETTPDKESALQKMIEVSSTPCLYKIFNFGKYKEKQIEEVVKIDRKYLEWLLDQKLASPDKDEDLIYTLEYYLGK